MAADKRHVEQLKAWLKEHQEGLDHEVRVLRRELHRFPELGWMEFRTASRVAARLEALGYEVQLGHEVLEASSRMGVPSSAALKAAYERAVAQGADLRYLSAMEGGFTAVVGVLRCGAGPVVALRFDMDANALSEAEEAGHKPFDEGFRSVNPGVMHACGHDGHTAVGLTVAHAMADLKADGHFRGTLKLIFQPAEEGVRGAKAMVDAGVLDDVDMLVGGHIMSMVPENSLICAANGFMATSKLDVTFRGQTAHAGGAPNEGRNALLAACSAVMNLNAIPHHKEGASRINVGVFQSGTDRNVIPDHALIQIETRGQTTAINTYVRDYALRIVEGAAQMHGVAVSVEPVGETCGGTGSIGLATLLKEHAVELGLYEEILTLSDAAMGSEDFMLMMQRVQSQGGEATYFVAGTAHQAGHHHRRFDLDESMLMKVVMLFVASASQGLMGDRIKGKAE